MPPFNPSNCTIGIENKTKIASIKEDVNRIEKKLDNNFGEVKNQLTDLFNHQSNRLPNWATGMITFLTSLVVGLGVYFLSRGGN